MSSEPAVKATVGIPTTITLPGFGAFSRRQLIVIGSVLLILACTALAGPRILYALHHVSTDDAYVDTHPLVLTAQETAIVQSVAVSEGQTVSAGTPLVYFDRRDAQIAYDQARENYGVAQAQYEQAQAEAAEARYDHYAASQRDAAVAQQNNEQSQAQSSAALAASADAQSARSRIDAARAALDAAQAAVPAARMHLRTAQDNYARVKTLAAQGYVSTVQLEQAQEDETAAQSQAAQATAQLDRARADLMQLQSAAASAAHVISESSRMAQADAYASQAAHWNDIGLSEQSVEAKDAGAKIAYERMLAAKDALREAQRRLQLLVLRAPESAYVASVPVAVGRELHDGDAAVVLMPKNWVYVTANYKETQLPHVDVGAPADVHIDAYPGVTFHGRVVSVGAASQSALSIVPDAQVTENFVKVAQRVPVRILLDPGGVGKRAMRPGISTEVSVQY